MVEELDFRYHGKIPLKYVKLWNQTAYKTHKPFSDFIDSLSTQHAKNIYWWASSPANRNTFANTLFHNCCCLALLQELVREKELISYIIVDSKALKKILESYLAKEGVIVKITLFRLPTKQRLKEFIRPIYMLFSLTMKQLRLFFAAKLTRSLSKPLPPEALTLIDTYIYSSNTDERHYTCIADFLTEEEKKTIYFIPLFHKPINLLLLFHKLRTDRNNFLLKEDFLKIQDYFLGWHYLFYFFKKKITPCYFLGVNISSLVREDLRSFKSLSYAYIPLLSYKFVKRLRQTDIKIRLFVDWFENQVDDKSLNAGFNQFFPEIPSIGYQGFIVTPHYLCIYPTIVEKESGVIPKEVAVIGKGLINSASKFCPDLNISVAPAFRFKGVWENRKYYPEDFIFTIMVALPIMLDIGDKILKLLDSYLQKRALTGVHFWIKQHPDNTIAMIKKQFASSWPVQFKFVNGDFNNCVEKSNLLISSGSSSCMHALAKGIPVIVVGSQSGLTHNPIPPGIEQDLWLLCHNVDELSKAIDFYMNRDEETLCQHEMIGEKIRNEYFEPMTTDTVRRFLKFVD